MSVILNMTVPPCRRKPTRCQFEPLACCQHLMLGRGTRQKCISNLAPRTLRYARVFMCMCAIAGIDVTSVHSCVFFLSSNKLSPRPTSSGDGVWRGSGYGVTLFECFSIQAFQHKLNKMIWCSCNRFLKAFCRPTHAALFWFFLSVLADYWKFTEENQESLCG